MSFIQREHDKINELLRHTPDDHPAHGPLYAAQQALGWALDPDCFASPSALIHCYYGVGDEGTQGTGVPVETLPAPIAPPPEARQ
jgi:hypothetical protein